MNVEQLWQERAMMFWNEAIRYLRLIGNSGFMFSLYILVLVGSYYYSTFLEWLPEQFPTVLFFSVLFAYMLTRSPIRTFVKEGDLVFLLPLEMRMSSYFRKSTVYSGIFQGAGMLLILVILAPLFFDRIHPEAAYWFVVFLGLMLAKGWNMASKWAELRIQTESHRWFHAWLRFVVNLVFAFLLFANAGVGFQIAVLAAMAVVYVWYYYPLLKQHRIKWQHLLEMENRMLMLFYRMANAFTDVPHLKGKVKARTPFAKLIDRVEHSQDHVYDFMFGKAFVRSNDYLGIYLRLTAIGLLFMYASPFSWLTVGLMILFAYMTGLQLSTLYHHFATKELPDIYPIRHGLKETSFKRLVKYLLFGQVALFSIGLLLLSASWLWTVAGIALAFLTVYWYAEYRVLKPRKKA
ncbi:ABC transporter permease [Salsuginibacillus kocurii]|uniref:ABC transporter permease n=1 Tax=Salsuginibacillus kocurii TaxID=427078 RepID=UPI00035FEDF0|nr:ABC transporter permease [Salsuginibacillus kocurii]